MISRPLTRSAGTHARTRTSVADGFTLVELLVVVSIIALLIAILLPSLKAAREQTKALKCQANQKSIMNANAAYQTEESEWFPGSPGTTGSALLPRYAGVDGKTEIIPEAPVQIWDWAGPLAGVQMGMKSLPANRAERWKYLIKDVFECPSNKILSLPFADNQTGPVGSFKAQKAISYNTIRSLLVWGAGVQGPNAQCSFAQFGGPSNTTKFPLGYAPRMERVGQPSEKIYISDGSRYLDPDTAEVDHEITWNAPYGGAFSSGGPTLADGFLRDFYRSDNEPTRHLTKFTYRHVRGKELGIAVGFFDGHSERLNEKRSRLPDYWWPKGTKIPQSQMNVSTYQLVMKTMLAEPAPDKNWYVVRR